MKSKDTIQYIAIDPINILYMDMEIDVHEKENFGKLDYLWHAGHRWVNQYKLKHEWMHFKC